MIATILLLALRVYGQIKTCSPEYIVETCSNEYDACSNHAICNSAFGCERSNSDPESCWIQSGLADTTDGYDLFVTLWICAEKLCPCMLKGECSSEFEFCGQALNCFSGPDADVCHDLDMQACWALQFTEDDVGWDEFRNLWYCHDLHCPSDGHVPAPQTVPIPAPAPPTAEPTFHVPFPSLPPQPTEGDICFGCAVDNLPTCTPCPDSPQSNFGRCGQCELDVNLNCVEKFEECPTQIPTQSPSQVPTQSPSQVPTLAPTYEPVEWSDSVCAELIPESFEVECSFSGVHCGVVIIGNQSCAEFCTANSLQCLDAFNEGGQDGCTAANHYGCQVDDVPYQLCYCGSVDTHPFCLQLDSDYRKLCGSNEDSCTVEIQTDGSCTSYCHSHGLQCAKSWNDVTTGSFDSCTKAQDYGCTGDHYDQICECSELGAHPTCVQFNSDYMEICSSDDNSCTVYADTDGTCSSYCRRYGMECLDAWNEGPNGDSCTVAAHYGCDTDHHGQVCECSTLPDHGFCRRFSSGYHRICASGETFCTMEITETDGVETCAQFCHLYGTECLDAWDDIDGSNEVCVESGVRQKNATRHNGCDESHYRQVCECGTLPDLLCQSLESDYKSICTGASGSCEVYVRTNGATCTEYCSYHGLNCTGGWKSDRDVDGCIRLEGEFGCNETSYTQICQCNGTLPTPHPTIVPTPHPTIVPTLHPTIVPTPNPTILPTSSPTMLLPPSPPQGTTMDMLECTVSEGGDLNIVFNFDVAQDFSYCDWNNSKKAPSPSNCAGSEPGGHAFAINTIAITQQQAADCFAVDVDLGDYDDVVASDIFIIEMDEDGNNSIQTYTFSIPYNLEETCSSPHVNDESLSCQWYDTENKVWNSSGCEEVNPRLETERGTEMVCKCSHLTAFAIIQDLTTFKDECRLSRVVGSTIWVVVIVLSGILITVCFFQIYWIYPRRVAVFYTHNVLCFFGICYFCMASLVFSGADGRISYFVVVLLWTFIATFSLWVFILVLFTWASMVHSAFGYQEPSSFVKVGFISVAVVSTIINIAVMIAASVVGENDWLRVVDIGSILQASLQFLLSILFLGYGVTLLRGITKISKNVQNHVNMEEQRGPHCRISIVFSSATTSLFVHFAILIVSVTDDSFYDHLVVYQVIYIVFDFIPMFMFVYLYNQILRKGLTRIANYHSRSGSGEPIHLKNYDSSPSSHRETCSPSSLRENSI